MKYSKLVIDNTKDKVVNDGSKCVCREVVIKIEKHTCPFKEEIHGDHETLCDCCEYCIQSCRLEV